jgi:hypothetical protein
MPRQNTATKLAGERSANSRKGSAPATALKSGKGGKREKSAAVRKRSKNRKAPSRNSSTENPLRSPLPTPGPRIPIGEALRVHGLDEHAIAENFANVVGKLKDKTDQSGSVEKLLVDVLKDCARHLDASAPAPRSASGDVPVIVHLVHNVQRPPRPVLDQPPASGSSS